MNLKTDVLILLFLFFSLQSFAQIDFKNPPWQIECDTLETQAEMNWCSSEKYQIAHKILNSYYDKLINHIESEYLNALKENDTTAFQREYLQQLKEQKAAIVKSKQDFVSLLNSTTDIINFQYAGGSMRPLVVNRYALELTINQIRILIDLTDEIIRP